MFKTFLHYAVVFAGLALLCLSVYVIPDQPLWLVLFVPLLLAWSTWLLMEYWRWVRSL